LSSLHDASSAAAMNAMKNFAVFISFILFKGLFPFR